MKKPRLSALPLAVTLIVSGCAHSSSQQKQSAEQSDAIKELGGKEEGVQPHLSNEEVTRAIGCGKASALDNATTVAEYRAKSFLAEFLDVKEIGFEVEQRSHRKLIKDGREDLVCVLMKGQRPMKNQRPRRTQHR